MRFLNTIGCTTAFLALMIFVPAGAFAHSHHGTAAGDPAHGKRIYTQNCAVCHGEDLQGPPNPKDFGKLVPPRLDAKGHASHHDESFTFNRI